MPRIHLIAASAKVLNHPRTPTGEIAAHIEFTARLSADAPIRFPAGCAPPQVPGALRLRLADPLAGAVPGVDAVYWEARPGGDGGRCFLVELHLPLVLYAAVARAVLGAFCEFDVEMEIGSGAVDGGTWIPACAGMTEIESVDFERLFAAGMSAVTGFGIALAGSACPLCQGVPFRGARVGGEWTMRGIAEDEGLQAIRAIGRRKRGDARGAG